MKKVKCRENCQTKGERAGQCQGEDQNFLLVSSLKSMSCAILVHYFKAIQVPPNILWYSGYEDG